MMHTKNISHGITLKENSWYLTNQGAAQIIVISTRRSTHGSSIMILMMDPAKYRIKRITRNIVLPVKETDCRQLWIEVQKNQIA